MIYQAPSLVNSCHKAGGGLFRMADVTSGCQSPIPRPILKKLTPHIWASATDWRLSKDVRRFPNYCSRNLSIVCTRACLLNWVSLMMKPGFPWIPNSLAPSARCFLDTLLSSDESEILQQHTHFFLRARVRTKFQNIFQRSNLKNKRRAASLTRNYN